MRERERERDWGYDLHDVSRPFMNNTPPPPPPLPHYVAANAIQRTTWGSLPPFPANQSSALIAADTNTHWHATLHPRPHIHTHTHTCAYGHMWDLKGPHARVSHDRLYRRSFHPGWVRRWDVKNLDQEMMMDGGRDGWEDEHSMGGWMRMEKLDGWLAGGLSSEKKWMQKK